MIWLVAHESNVKAHMSRITHRPRGRPGARPRLAIRAVQGAVDARTSHDIQVVVDSGADASCLPYSWAGVGVCSEESSDKYWDAQGRALEASQTREAVITIGHVSFKERWLLSSVTQPLFCVGKLMRQGWDIVHDDARVPFLCNPQRTVRVPMFYKRNSLHAKGSICTVSSEPNADASSLPRAPVEILPERRGSVNALELGDPWLKLKAEYVELSPGVYARRDEAHTLLDCLVHLGHVGVSYRTTLILGPTGWNLLELNTELAKVTEEDVPSKRAQQLITIASVKPLDFTAAVGRIYKPQEGDEQAAPVIPGTPEAPDSEADLPEAAEGMDVVEDVAPASDNEQDASAIAVPPLQSGHVVVGGVELHMGCTLATLRAACGVLGIGKSGGKSTILQRIESHLKKQDLLLRHEFQTDARDFANLPREHPKGAHSRREKASCVESCPVCRLVPALHQVQGKGGQARGKETRRS